MPFRITPSLGPQVGEVYKGIPHWDSQLTVEGAPTDVEPSYKLGSVVRGSDGGEYFFVQASANIASTATTGTEVDMTFATHSVATKAGAGGFWTPPGVAVKEGDYLHVRRGAWNANPA